MRQLAWFLIVGLCTCGGNKQAPTRPSTAKDRVRFEPQIGHAGRVGLIDLSADGRYALTAAHTAKVWDVETGAVIRTLDNPTDEDFDVAEFVGDGTDVLLARSGTDGTVDGTIRDALTGEVKKTLDEVGITRQQAVTAGELAYGFHFENENEIAVFETSTNRPLAEISVDPDVTDSELTRDGKTLIVGTPKGLVLYDVATRKRIHADLETGPLDRFAISPDGRLVCAANARDVNCWNITPSAVTLEHELEFEVDRNKVSELEFAGNTQLLVGAAKFQIVDLATAIPRAYPRVSTFKLSRDGTRLIKYQNSLSSSDALVIYDLVSGRLLHNLPAGIPASLNTASWSADGRQLVVNGTIWDIRNLRVVRRFSEDDNAVKVVRFIGNDQLRAVVWELGEQELWLVDAASGHRRERLDVKEVSPEERYWMSRDGRDLYGAVYESDGSVQPVSFGRWDTTTGNRLGEKSDSGVTTTLGANLSTGTRVPDGGRFPWVVDGRFEIWDFQSGKTVQSFPLNRESSAPVLSPDGKRVAIDVPGAIEIWDLATHQLVKTLSTATWSKEWVSPDRLLIGQLNGNVALWDVTAGKSVWTKRDHGAQVTDLAVSPDGKLAASTSEDGSTRLWQLATGESIALVSVGDDWIVYDNEGYFDASKQGSKLVAAIDGVRAFRIDQLAARNNRPDLLLAKVGLGDPAAIEHFRALHDRRLDRAKLDRNNLAAAFSEVPRIQIVDATVTGKQMKVTFEIAATAELRSYNVWANGVPLLGDGKPTSGRAARLTETVELTEGENRVEVGAIDRRGGESLRAYRNASYRGKTTGDLYYLAFGVSTYRNATFNLAYAHKDAADLAEVLRRTAGYGQVHVKVITNADATVDAIRGAKQFLASAKVDDTVVLFVAGHGLHARDKTADYYFATHEVDLDNLPRTAAPFELVEDLLQGIAPRRKLFLMDTCESGDVDPGQQAAAVVRSGARGLTSRALVRVDEKRPSAAAPAAKPREYLLDRDRFIYADVFRRSGAIVLSSSHGTESSYELDELKNGAFTEAILRALTGIDTTADADGDKRVSTQELARALARDVPARTNGLQHPTIDRDNLDVVTTLPLVPAAKDVADR